MNSNFVCIVNWVYLNERKWSADSIEKPTLALKKLSKCKRV